MSETKLRCALYVRVSTTGKKSDGEYKQDLGIQKDDLLKYAELRGWEVAGVYEDRATGTNGDRPGFKQLMADAHKRKFDLLAIWKLDRLFRSTRELLNTVNELDNLGIKFVSFNDSGIDTGSINGRFLMEVLSAVASMESSLLKMRCDAGRKAAKARGVKFGPKPKIDATIRNQVMILLRKGLTQRQIAKKLRIGKGSVQRAIVYWTKCRDHIKALDGRNLVAR